MDLHPIQGGVEILHSLYVTETGDKLQPGEPLGLYTGFTLIFVSFNSSKLQTYIRILVGLLYEVQVYPSR